MNSEPELNEHSFNVFTDDKNCLDTEEELQIRDLSTSPPSKMRTSEHILPWQLWLFRLVRVSVAFKSLPFARSRSSDQIRITQRRFELWLWYCRLLVLTVDCIYLLLVSRVVTSENVGAEEVMDFWIHTSSRIVGCLVIWAIAVNLEGTAQLYNTLATTPGIWKDRFKKYGLYNNGRLQKILGKFFRVATIFATFQAIGPFIQYFINRQSARYWGSFCFPSEIYNSIPGIMFFGLYEFFNLVLTIQCVIFGGELMIASYVLIRFWVTGVRDNVMKYGNSSNVPLSQYRSLLCLGCIINQEMGTTICPTITSLSSLMLCVPFAAVIKMGRDLTTEVLMVEAIGCPLIAVGLYFVYTAGAEVLGRSEEIKRLLKQRNGLLRQKEIQSLKDIRMYLGQFYYMTEDAFISNMQWVVDHTVDIVLLL